MQASFFKCLHCGGTNVITSDKNWECCHCHTQYVVEEGIPILVRDWDAHKDQLEEAKSVKPDWYVVEQPAEQASPWRHHIKKRRKFVEATIASFLTSNGQTYVDSILDLGCGDGNHLTYLQ